MAVRVGGSGQFPGDAIAVAEEVRREGCGVGVLLVVGGVGGVEAEGAQDLGQAVGFVVGQGFAGPFA